MPPRQRSLDVFRGATVALMILVNNPGSWGALYPPLAHAAWHGCTPTDLVFPFFLFAVGNALALVQPRLQGAEFWPRVLRRTALIFAIGLLLNASPFVRWDAAGELVPRDVHTLRLMGVLQRIALCFGAAAVIVRLAGPRGVPWAVAALLVGYWAACHVAGAPGDPWGPSGWFGTAVDRALLGEAHLYRGEGRPFDPEGLASTPPAVAQVLLGWWVGCRVAAAPASPALVRRLLGWGALLLAAGWLWQLEMPLNKKIWTSSYVLFTSGLATLALAACLQGVDLRAPAPAGGRAGAFGRAIERFFEVFGRNPLFVFVASGFVPRVLALVRWPGGTAADGSTTWTSPLPWVYQTVFAPLPLDPRLASLLYACANLALYAALAWWLDRRRLYIRV